ncbi:MAG: ComF family protein [Oscillospiraceae bacterium]|nr:ComF family protein [Oscillospiraceae bacterium]
MRTLWERLLDLLYPPKCAFCGALIPAQRNGICAICEKTLPYTKNGGRQKGNFFTACVSPLYYEEDVRDALLRYKFRHCSGYCRPFGQLVAVCTAENLDQPVDLVSWVPLSSRRLRKRGYDQARLLAEETARRLEKPCVPVLKKTVHTAPQSRTGSAEKRRANISGAYRVTDPALVRGKTILLIDDIVTTGSTFSECARMLGMAGADRVFCASVARSRD